MQLRSSGTPPSTPMDSLTHHTTRLLRHSRTQALTHDTHNTTQFTALSHRLNILHTTRTTFVPCWTQCAVASRAATGDGMQAHRRPVSAAHNSRTVPCIACSALYAYAGCAGQQVPVPIQPSNACEHLELGVAVSPHTPHYCQNKPLPLTNRLHHACESDMRPIGSAWTRLVSWQASLLCCSSPTKSLAT